MVVFTCNHCGDSLQKPKVLKHYQFQCRKPIFVTCVDCHKDFRGDEHTVHTKCITENERYGGKNYVSKPSANKGEKKQQAWLNAVQDLLNNSTHLTVPERNLLNSISRHENIPRKKTKFLNFIKSLSNNKVNMTIAECVWEKMECSFKKTYDESNSNTLKSDENNTNKEENKNNFICKEINNVEETNVLSKVDNTQNNKKEKKSKRYLAIDENSNEPITKRKKKVSKAIEESQNKIDSINNINKFSWKNTILEIVTTKEEISLKKLRKKVIAQYLSNFPSVTLEKAASKFEKKLGKMSDIFITENKVKLASS